MEISSVLQPFVVEQNPGYVMLYYRIEEKPNGLLEWFQEITNDPCFLRLEVSNELIDYYDSPDYIERVPTVKKVVAQYITVRLASPGTLAKI